MSALPFKSPKHAWVGAPKLHIIQHVKADLDRGSWLEYLPVHLPEGVGAAFAQECIRKLAIHALTQAAGVFKVGDLRIDLGAVHEQTLDADALRDLLLSQGYGGVHVVDAGDKWGAYLLPQVLCEDAWVSGFADRRTRSREQQMTERPGWRDSAQDIAELLEDSRDMAYCNRRRDLEELRGRAIALSFADLQEAYMAPASCPVDAQPREPRLVQDEFWRFIKPTAVGSSILSKKAYLNDKLD